MSPPALVLLDRDGTLNRKAPEGRYVTSPDELELLPGAGEALARLNRAGIPVALVTNQRAIARGLLTEDGLAALHDALADRLAVQSAHLDAIYHCPHERGACDCRKPRPGLLAAALRDFATPAEEAVMIGDAASDVEAGRRAGTATIRLTASAAPGATAADLRDAVALLLGPP